jgi:hypothetical protein
MMLRLSVNLSVQQLQHDSCLAVVDEALRASGLAPQYLDLEITESVIISHPEKAVATLVKLKERGISITVDDFGTGTRASPISPAADRGAQDRPALRARPRAQQQRRRDHAGDHRAVALARLARDRRRRGDARAVLLPQESRLRVGAGIL